MSVLRIVPNIAATDMDNVAAFYRDLLDLETVMQLDFITTLKAPGTCAPQLSIVREGGGGTPVPDLSIEVTDVDETHARAVAMGAQITLPLHDTDWGLRRFFVTDPAGRTLNILSHRSD
ncbi:VOC family protein [Sulfitobacter albidus]|uniref:VOC family protein n=1 Tax=Sulfitobacter albidus TaxID=2829501 RepID=A0A975JDI3_9RHOB|nr:VOC family protein [Sulfitobacter albidus]QUJ76479.1 VOC family protein [Sulfitobacter albidus]